MTTTFHALAGALGATEQRGGDVEIHDATHDSRQVGPGTLFCAVVGARTDGHDHARAAVEAGAVALLVERWLELDVPQLRVESVRATMGPAAALIHGEPSAELTIIGVTGTNGKTTTAYLLESAFGAAGWGTGTIGTIETRINGAAQPGVRTTPEGPDLQRMLGRMRDRGVDGVAMEVSSHGLDLHRVAGTLFRVAVFTNLSQDHLDFHGTMEAYFEAKARLFRPSMSQQAVICVDDEWGRLLADRTGLPTRTFGEHPSAAYRITAVDATVTGSAATVAGPEGVVEVRTQLVGEFNATNAVGAYLAALTAGVEPEAALAGIAACPGVPGRLERVDAGQPFAVLVDYAHTPDALARVIDATRRVLTGGRLHVVIGCGGDRDMGKRPLMGAVAAGADRAILTSDNPRSEDPSAVLDAIVTGARAAVEAGARAEIVAELDRRAAIRTALSGAVPGDVVVIAGKGHETGQTIGDETFPFDDRVVASELLDELRPAGAVGDDT